MKSPVFSIIIPHYNIPELLERCLKSIPYNENFQIIVIDDCSNDFDKIKRIPGTLSRPNIEVYSTHIGGSAGRARNLGIEHAKGQWLIFIDADDLLSEDAEDILLQYYKSDVDIMYFNVKSVMSDNLQIESTRNVFDYHFKHYWATNDDKPLRYEFDALWGKVIKKNLIEKYNIRFDEVKYSNDTFFSAAIGVYANKISVYHEPLYIVTEREGSLTSVKKKTIEELLIRFQATLHVQDLFDKNELNYKRYAFAEYIETIYSINKIVSLKTICKLSPKNFGRFIYFKIRKLIRK